MLLKSSVQWCTLGTTDDCRTDWRGGRCPQLVRRLPAAKENNMKAYGGSEKCLPFDYYFKKPDSEDDLESLLEGQVIEGRFNGPDLDLELIDQVAVEEEAGIPALAEAEPEEEGPVEAEAAAAPIEDFEEDHITCYLKEVSSYPLLTQERETELAQIIRDGQDELVQIVWKHAPDDKIMAELNEKVKKLLEHEKTFPGVRDKVLKVVMRTLERAADEHPENPLFSTSLARVCAIMRAVDTVTTILGNKRALLKMTPPAKPGEPAKEQSFTLGEGQREGDIEVLEINENAGTVKVNDYGTITTLDFDKDGVKVAGGPPPPAAGAGARPAGFVPAPGANPAHACRGPHYLAPAYAPAHPDGRCGLARVCHR